VKIGLLGDLHIRSSRPVCRIDDYYENQFNKLAQAFDHFKDENCKIVLQPGDFFHNYGKDPYDVVYDTIAFLMIYRLPIYLVFGQHDVKFHNTCLTDIPIQILNKTDLIHKIEKDKATKVTYLDESVYLYGSSWKEDHPKETARARGFCTKILVTHEMIIKNKRLWHGQKEYTEGRSLKHNTNFDLFVCGDNHQAFSLNNKVINCGSLMRMREDQENHQPQYAIYDTKTRELSVHKYKIDDFSQVAKKNTKKTEKDEEELKREIFAESLKNDLDDGELDYRTNINKVMKKRIRKKKTSFDDRVANIIEESLSEDINL
jgi:DNA repair exonuclease SbcCD nuclease subunit